MVDGSQRFGAPESSRTRNRRPTARAGLLPWDTVRERELVRKMSTCLSPLRKDTPCSIRDRESGRPWRTSPFSTRPESWRLADRSHGWPAASEARRPVALDVLRQLRPVSPVGVADQMAGVEVQARDLPPVGLRHQVRHEDHGGAAAFERPVASEAVRAHGSHRGASGERHGRTIPRAYKWTSLDEKRCVPGGARATGPRENGEGRPHLSVGRVRIAAGRRSPPTRSAARPGTLLADHAGRGQSRAGPKAGLSIPGCEIRVRGSPARQEP